MKRPPLYLGAGLLVALLAGWAWAAQAGRPVNRKCPLKPDIRIDPTVTTVYRGKVIGLCCTDCLDKWKKNPDAYIGKVKEDANQPVEPEGYATAKEAVNGGKNAGRPAVILFVDKGAGSQGFIKVISDVSLEAEFAKVSYAKVQFNKDSDEAKLYKVASAPTMIILDPREDPPKVLKTLTSGGPGAIAGAFKDAVKKLGGK